MSESKWVSLVVIVLVTASLSSGSVSAQPAFNPGPAFGPGGEMARSNGPVVSPYINLLRNGNPAYLNYFGMVRPQQNFSNQIGNIQQQGFASANSAITDLDTQLPALVTGRRSGFQNSYKYFQNQYALTGGGGYGAGAYGGATGAGMNRGGMGMGMGTGMGMGNQQMSNPMLQPGSGMNVPVPGSKRGR